MTFTIAILGTASPAASDVFFDFMDEWIENNILPTQLLIPEKRTGVPALAAEWADLMNIPIGTFNSTKRDDADAALRTANQVVVLKLENKTDIWVRRLMQFATNHSIPVSTYELVGAD